MYAHIFDNESLVSYLFDLSLSYSVCGVDHGGKLPYVYMFLVENKDKTTTNIDSEIIDVISKIEFAEENNGED